MAGSVFGGSISAPTVVRSGKAIVTVDNKTLLALQVTVQFQRSVEVVPTLGTKRVVGLGEPQGTFTAQTIIAKDDKSFEAFKLSGADCRPFDMTISFDASASCDAGGKTIKAKNCFASAITVTAQGGRGYITNDVTVTFTALEM